jgi:hypothetical protein
MNSFEAEVSISPKARTGKEALRTILQLFHRYHLKVFTQLFYLLCFRRVNLGLLLLKNCFRLISRQLLFWPKIPKQDFR